MMPMPDGIRTPGTVRRNR